MQSKKIRKQDVKVGMKFAFNKDYNPNATGIYKILHTRFDLATRTLYFATTAECKEDTDFAKYELEDFNWAVGSGFDPETSLQALNSVIHRVV